MPYCSKCKKEKEKMQTTKTCKRCAELGKKYYHSHKEKQAKTNKIWRSTKSGKEKQKYISNKWRKNNPEKYKKLMQSYYVKNSIKPSYRFRKAKQQARERGITFLINLELYTKLISLPCYFCKGAFGTVTKGTGLDRIDSSGEYEENNVVPCCKTCNMLKGDQFTLDEAKVAVDAILAFRINQFSEFPIQ